MSSHGNYKSPLMSQNNLLRTPTRPTFSRYSLADSWVASPPSQERNNSHTVNISTRIDSSSPGYSSRLVHYNEEQEKSTPKRNGRYDKLGVFPIVHFFKKDLPVLKRKPTPANSFDLSKYNSSEHNKMLLERIIKSSPGTPYAAPYKNESNTKSVLDALKEISRKRIHANADEYVVNEEGKRSHVDSDSGSSSRKRLKQNCLQREGVIPITSPPLRPSPMNELTASHSSTVEYFAQKRQKRKHEVPAVPSPAPTPVVSPTKCVDVETQTTLPPQPPPPPPPETIAPPPVATIEAKPAKETTPNAETKKPKRTSPLIIFDETPLERLRKNRLNALLGCSTPKTPPKVEEKAREEPPPPPVVETPKQDKPLVGILSGGTKSPHKANKHVTFEIPEMVTPCVENAISDASVVKTPPGAYTVTRTSSAVAMPIVSASIIESPVAQKPPAKSEVPTITFNSQTPIITSMPFGGTMSPSPVAKPVNPVPSFQIQTPASVASPVSSATTVQMDNFLKKPSESATVQQPGGFKFELKQQNFKSVPFSVLTTSPSLNAAMPQLSQPLVSKETPPSFNPSSSKPQEMSNGSSNKPFGAAPIGTFNFNRTQVDTPLNFTTKVSTPSFMNGSPFSFGGNKNPNPTVATTSSAPEAGNSNVFKNPVTTSFNSAVSSAGPFSFGGATSSMSSTPFPNTSNSFAAPSSSSMSVVFGDGGASKPPTSETPFFSPPSGGFGNKTPAFGSGSNVTGFGNDGKKSMFGQNPVPSFGATGSTFGNPDNTVPNTNTFGNVTPKQGGVFGNFEASSEAASGNPSRLNFGSSNFAANQKSTFGNAPTSMAKTGFSAPFGAATNSPFSASTNTTPFSAMKPAFSTTSNTFSPQTQVNPSPSTFGSQAQANPTPSAFGSQTQANPSASTFGSQTQANPTPSAFGSQTQANPTPSAFGSQAQVNPSASTFGQQTQAAPSAPAFGSPLPTAVPATFGSGQFSSGAAAPQGDLFTFGSAAASTKPGIFSFGASKPPEPSFNFQAQGNAGMLGANGGNNNNNTGAIFGGGGAAASATASASPLPMQQFNVQPSGSNMFNIGTGGSPAPNRFRTQHKGKRRT